MLAGGSGPGGFNAVPSGNPTGTGSSLNYIGQFVYANSGGISAGGSGNAITQMEFTTSGNRVIVGEFALNGAVLSSDQDTGSTCAFEIFLNDEVILKTKVDTLQEDQPASMVFPVVIPPQSKIKITAMCSNTNGQTTVNLVGRHYG